MKKYIYLLLLLFLFLTSCNNKTETKPNENNSTPNTLELELSYNDKVLECGKSYDLPETNIEVTFETNSKNLYLKDNKIYPLKTGNEIIKAIPKDKNIEDKEINIKIENGTTKEIKKMKNFVYSLGRNEILDDKIIMHNSASSLTYSFHGTKLELELQNITEPRFKESYLSYLIDDETDQNKNRIHFEGNYNLVIDNLENTYHEIKLLKCNESKFSKTIVKKAKTDGYFTFHTPNNKLKLEVYGDSITCGYSVYGEPYSSKNTNALDSYAYHVSKDLNADLSVLASSGIGLIKGETNINIFNCYNKLYQGSKTTFDMTTYIPDIVIINLGTNDTWMGVDKKIFVNTYIKFINNLKEIYGNETKFILAGGMMTKDINKEINEVTENFNKDVYFIDLPQTKINGHPLVDDQIAASKEIIKLINKLI